MNWNEWRNNVIGYSIATVVMIAIVLGIWWLMWQLWTWVLPQIWPTGPDAIVRPGYWLWVGMSLVAGIIGRTLFGRNDK